MKKRKDGRPICDCSAYNFPHKLGGKCKGYDFLEYYFYNDGRCCQICNCNRDDIIPRQCDAFNGAESIKEAECYIERSHSYPGEHLPLIATDKGY